MVDESLCLVIPAAGLGKSIGTLIALYNNSTLSLKVQWERLLMIFVPGCG
jgi:hypothetical protein